jgi:hypothetical protein
LVVRIRMAPNLWAHVSRNQPDFDRKVERFLRASECRLFEEPVRQIDRKTGTATETVRHVIVAGGFEFRLERPVGNVCWDYDLVELFPRTEREGSGMEISDRIVVSSPDCVIPDEVVFIINNRSYRKMSAAQLAPVNMAWQRIRKGRTMERVSMGEDTIFLLALNPDAPLLSTEKDAQNLDDELRELGVGRVFSDQYELKRAHQLAARYGDMEDN